MPKPKLPRGKAKQKIIQTRVTNETYKKYINYCNSKNITPSEMLRLFILSKIYKN